MERKQLDFNAPLLSVRRFSPKLVPSNRDTRKLNVNTTLPTNRRNSTLSVRPDFNLEQVTEPVAVPFTWEHIPGRAKSKSGPIPRSKPLDEPLRKEIEHQNLFRTIAQMSFSNSNLTKLELSDWENGGDDDAYSDALDTLSPASFSRNCSVSGLSGSGGLDHKPSGTFSTDPQTRDFMLSRFLPAAQAMTLDPPHYPSRKQASTHVSHEQPREVKKMVIDDKKLLARKYDTRIIPYVEEVKMEEESESEADDYQSPALVSAKSRGFLPRLRSSLCLLNPMPGMKFRSQSPKPSPKASPKATPKAPSNEVRKPKKAFSGPLIHNIEKHSLNTTYTHKFENGLKNKQRPVRQSYSGELPTTNRSSPYRNSHSGGVSPCRNERPASPLHQAMKFIGIPKIVQTFKADRSSAPDKGQKNEYGQGAMSRPAEKTLYIDSLNTVEYTNFRPNSSETKGKMQHESKNLNVLKRSKLEKAKVSEYGNGDSPSYPDISHVKSRGEPRKNSNSGPLNSNMNPPLPKCPSESWLWRTLPSVPSRSSSPQSRKVAQVTSTTCTKWENIVKTSYLHHDHMRYSQELVANSRKQTRT